MKRKPLYGGCGKSLIATAAGFYEGSVTVEARGEDGAELYYTTDGETPTKRSKPFPADGLKLKKDHAAGGEGFPKATRGPADACRGYLFYR